MAVRRSLLIFAILTLQLSSHYCISEIADDVVKTVNTEETEEDLVAVSSDRKDDSARITAVHENSNKFRSILWDARGFRRGRVTPVRDGRDRVTKDSAGVSKVQKSEWYIVNRDKKPSTDKETDALNFFHIYGADQEGERACLRVDAGEQVTRIPTFWDVIVDGRTVQDFELMSAAVVSHNMSKYTWFPFNTTKPTPPTRRFTCVPRNVTQQRVRIVSSAELVQMLGPKNESRGYCAVVMFYAPWCVFCARVAPHYNALARAFPQLDVLAIDAMHFSNLNSRFGTVAVPSILLFHNSKAVSRFNGTLRILDSLVAFVSNVTGLQANISVGVLPNDYNGPLASAPTTSPDYLLWLAWSFTITFFVVVLTRSTVFARLINSVLSFGQEHEAIH